MKKTSALFEGGSKATQLKKKITFGVICASFALLMIMLVVLIIALIATGAGGKAEPTDEQEPVVSIGDTTTVTLSDSDLYSGNLLLLDATHSYNGDPLAEAFPPSAERPQATSNAMYTVQNQSLGATEETINAFHNLVKAFYEKSKDDNLIVYDAYNTSSGASAPVFSAGTAIELYYFSAADAQDWSKRDSIQGVEKYKWIYTNAAKYGFINVSVDGQASSVFRYVGVEHASAMLSKKLNPTSYIEWLKANTSPEAPLASRTASGNYAIYYISAMGEHTVPVGYDYTVSGTNEGGYIITVNLSAAKAS